MKSHPMYNVSMFQPEIQKVIERPADSALGTKTKTTKVIHVQRIKIKEIVEQASDR